MERRIIIRGIQQPSPSSLSSILSVGLGLPRVTLRSNGISDGILFLLVRLCASEYSQRSHSPTTSSPPPFSFFFFFFCSSFPFSTHWHARTLRYASRDVLARGSWMHLRISFRLWKFLPLDTRCLHLWNTLSIRDVCAYNTWTRQIDFLSFSIPRWRNTARWVIAFRPVTIGIVCNRWESLRRTSTNDNPFHENQFEQRPRVKRNGIRTSRLFAQTNRRSMRCVDQ